MLFEKIEDKRKKEHMWVSRKLRNNIYVRTH